MRKQWIFILLLPCLSLTAQNNNKDEPTVLHQEGITLVAKENSTLFDQLKALDKFLQSHLLLEDAPAINDTFYLKNKKQIQTLFAIFTHHQDTDSLLQTTRFFPDSIFQANSSYSTATKALINQFLTLQRTVRRNDFFEIRDLKYPKSLLQEGEKIPRITFENYWALELIQFEQWLLIKEKQLRNYPKQARQELLELYLQTEVLTLQNQAHKTTQESSKRRLLEQVKQAKKETETATADYKEFKKNGLGILATALLLGYFLWKKKDKLLKSNNQSLLEEKKRSEDILTNMLPAEVVRELKRKGTVKARKYESVSVFFSDFKNFSQIAETLSPEDLIEELDSCFTAFDRIIEKYRLQKVKTIGDAYMCVGGLYTRGDHHIHRMVFAALEIQQFLANRKKERSGHKAYFFEARIGIHTGPIVAGVIGSKKIAFDIWGDTVNVAQQMEQHSEVGEVNISGETFNAIKEQFECIERGSVTAKNRKAYDMYYVHKIKK